MKTKNYFRAILVALLIGVMGGVSVQAADVVILKTTKSEIKINAYFSGSGSITANGVAIAANNTEVWETVPVIGGTVTISTSGSKCMLRLDVKGQGLTSLNILKGSDLYILNCYDNNLTELDVSKFSKLETLYCSKNKLTSLNVTKN